MKASKKVTCLDWGYRDSCPDQVSLDFPAVETKLENSPVKDH
jgi:hypothetical protein